MSGAAWAGGSRRRRVRPAFDLTEPEPAPEFDFDQSLADESDEFDA